MTLGFLSLSLMRRVNHLGNTKEEKTLEDKSEHVKFDMRIEYLNGHVGRQVSIGVYRSGDRAGRFGTHERYSNS